MTSTTNARVTGAIDLSGAVTRLTSLPVLVFQPALAVSLLVKGVFSAARAQAA